MDSDPTNLNPNLDSRKKNGGFGFKSGFVHLPFNHNPIFRNNPLHHKIELPIVKLSYIDCARFKSGFVFKVVWFEFGFRSKKFKRDLDSCGFRFEAVRFGSGFGFEMPGFTHHWFLYHLLEKFLKLSEMSSIQNPIILVIPKTRHFFLYWFSVLDMICNSIYSYFVS